MCSIFNDEFSKIYDTFNYDEKLKIFLDIILDFCDKNDIKLHKHIDMGCGTGSFCKMVKEKNIDTKGIDISEGMLKVAKEKYPQIMFEHSNIVDYKENNEYDFITCTFDTINHLLELEQWDKFLKNICALIKQNGIFAFDFITMKKYKNANEILFSTRKNDKDYIICRFPIENNLLVSKYIYYLQSGKMYKKIEQTIVEAFFETEDIIKLLEKNGFEIKKIYNKKLQEITDFDSNRVYIICQKK